MAHYTEWLVFDARPAPRWCERCSSLRRTWCLRPACRFSSEVVDSERQDSGMVAHDGSQPKCDETTPPG